MTDLEGSEDLFWHQRVERMGEGGGGGGGGANGRFFTFGWVCFSTFLSL